MCDSYHLSCRCGRKDAEIFFGRMVLNEQAITALFCPECSKGHDHHRLDRVWDNGWVLEFDMEVVRSHAATFGVAAAELTASWVFDQGYITWVGITPDETARRNREREEIHQLAKTDLLAYLQAMKEWGIAREQRFIQEGWRKMQ